MVGHRLPDGFEPTLDWYAKLNITELPKGGYGKDRGGTWCVVTPNGRYGSVSGHTVVEHEDGSITVSPSILIYPVAPKTYTPDERAEMVKLTNEQQVRTWEVGVEGWHGWLERGVWRSC